MNIKKILRPDISYVPLIVFAGITVSFIYLLYSQTQAVLTERLRERLSAIAGTAALQINAQDVENIIQDEDVKNPALARVISTMKGIRDANEDLRYIYIWRKTDNPTMLKFVADAEMIDPIDENNNGLIEAEEIPPAPGEDYDISDTIEVLNGFEKAYALEDFIDDKWGVFMSGYAPVRNEKGEAIAVLGTDVLIRDFHRIVKTMFLPLSILATFLLFILIAQTVWLVRIWRNRVDIVKELDRQKDELLSIVSHQLATPVTSIRWQLEMMLDGDIGKITEKQKEHIESTQKVTANLVDLIQMILDVSRIQLGKMQVSRQELDLNEFFKDLINVIEPKAKEKKTKFKVSIPTKLPVAMLDKRLTNMTLENLLSNAVKYTPSGGDVEFTVTLAGDRIKVVVKDTGVGIPEKDQSQIFGKLYRATNVRNTVDGNGFGLYVAKGAVEGQGGTIRFESKEGKGTTFYVELPLK